MAFWSRLKQSKHNFILFSNELKRCYYLNHSPISANQHIRSLTSISSLINHNYVGQSSQLELLCKVRSYAAPIQFLTTPKKEEKDPEGHRKNEQITAPTIRLVDDANHFIISREEALARAKSLKMDLVEVDRHNKPPVCKIYDYNKAKYMRQVHGKELAKSKMAVKKGCKEVRFGAKIKQKDLEVKANMVRRLMESGHRVKCTAIEPTDALDVATLLSRFRALIEDVAIEEGEPQSDAKQAFVVVRHTKFGPSKKGGKKKAPKSAVSSETGSTNQASEDNGELTETEDAGSEVLSEEAIFDGDDDMNDYKNGLESPKHLQPAEVTQPKQTMENRYERDPRSRIPTDANGRSPRKPMNTVPQVPNQGKYPQFGMNGLPQRRTNQKDQVPAHPATKQNSNSPTKSYGIFSAHQKGNTEAPREQSAPAETNRYQRNPPVNRGPTVDNFGQGKPNMIPNKKYESQSEFQRR